MKNPSQPITTIPSDGNSLYRSPWRGGYLLLAIIVTALSFALSPTARAVDPPPDGGYPNGNTAEGDDALFSLTNGINNTAMGFQALFSNTKGYDNTAIGFGALYQNTSGFLNTASGFQALYFNTTGKRNTAHGLNALYANTTGSNNTAYGIFALGGNTTGSNNIGLGLSAGGAISTGSNNIDIGNVRVEGESQTIRIGDSHQTTTFIAGISGTTAAGGVTVFVNTNGQLGTQLSSARYKDAIKPMDKASEAILALQPVTFRYKQELDPAGIPQFGLVAEEVEKVNPDLVARDGLGKAYTVRYEAVNAMLLNEFLKEHRKVEQLEATVAQEQKQFEATAAQQKGFESLQRRAQETAAHQQKEIEALTATLKAQAAQIQNVSERLKISKAAPRVVVNNQ